MIRAEIHSLNRQSEMLPFDEASDAVLLERYLLHKEETVFSVLMRRHGAMVWSVCRQMLGSDADAEDAFQATFVTLLRNGDRIRDRSKIASWLHGVAFRIAMKIRRSASLRKQHETRSASTEADIPISEARWHELHSAVHEEIDRLPESLRSTFVLCCLEGMRHAEAAQILGLKVNTLTARLARARESLIRQLCQRGIALNAAAGALALTTTAVSSAAPSRLMEQFSSITKNQEAIPGILLSLSQGALTMGIRTKWIAASVVAVGAMTTTLGAWFYSNATAQPPSGATGGPPAVTSATAGTGGAKGPGMMRMGGIPRQTWEYKTVVTQTTMNAAELNSLGDEGWELIQVMERGKFYFKRPKQSGGFGGMDAFGGGPRTGSADGGGLGAGLGGAGGGVPGLGGGPGAEGTPGGGSAASRGGRSSRGGLPGGLGSEMGSMSGDQKAEKIVTEVYQLKHSNASDLSSTIAPLLSTDDDPRRFGGSPRLTGKTRITVDQRTNTLIVIADESTQKMIKELIARLDVEVKDDPTKPATKR